MQGNARAWFPQAASGAKAAVADLSIFANGGVTTIVSEVK